MSANPLTNLLHMSARQPGFVVQMDGPSVWTSRRCAAETLGTGTARWSSSPRAILTVIAAGERDYHTRDADQTLIPLTFNGIRRLHARLITDSIHTIDHLLHWSTWRRRHQARARTSHDRRHGQLDHLRHLRHEPWAVVPSLEERSIACCEVGEGADTGVLECRAPDQAELDRRQVVDRNIDHVGAGHCLLD